jgi:hypothetical protein
MGKLRIKSKRQRSKVHCLGCDKLINPSRALLLDGMRVKSKPIFVCADCREEARMELYEKGGMQ